MIPIVGRDLGVIVLIPNESRALRPKSKPTTRFWVSRNATKRNYLKNAKK